MKIEEVFPNEFMKASRTTKGVRMSFRSSLKQIAAVLTAGLMCAGSYYWGYDSNSSAVKNLEDQINLIHDVLKEMPLSEERMKRDVNEEHVLVKRSGGNAPVAVVTTTNPGINGGATYIRWGRSDCEDTAVETEIVYTGLMAGTHYTYTGGGANYLCLDHNVSYPASKYSDGFQSGSNMHGVEYYESGLAHLFDMSLIEARGFHQYQVPCAVCMARGRANQLMIPGQSSCPNLWKLEYGGYIMASAHGNKHTGQYVCVDEKPQVVHGSDGSQPGERLYMVETECPSIQCDPYVYGRELKCVVCTI